LVDEWEYVPWLGLDSNLMLYSGEAGDLGGRTEKAVSHLRSVSC